MTADLARQALELAQQHIAGHDVDMRGEPACQRCHESLYGNSEPSAFCSSCIYVVADSLATAVLRAEAVIAAARELDGTPLVLVSERAMEARDALRTALDALDGAP